MTANTIQTPARLFMIGRGILLTMSLGNALAFTGMLFFVPDAELLMMTWAAFNFLAAMILLIPYRRGETWAWYTIWALVLPYALIILFTAERGPIYMAEAFILMIGQLLTFKTFFSR